MPPKTTPQGPKIIYKILIPSTGKWEITDDEHQDLESADEAASESKYAKWPEHPFLVERQVVQKQGSDFPDITTQILVQNEALVQALKGVMKGVQRMSWNIKPLKVIYASFIPQKRTPILSLRWIQISFSTSFLGSKLLT